MRGSANANTTLMTATETRVPTIRARPVRRFRRASSSSVRTTSSSEEDTLGSMPLKNRLVPEPLRRDPGLAAPRSRRALRLRVLPACFREQLPGLRVAEGPEHERDAENDVPHHQNRV